MYKFRRPRLMLALAVLVPLALASVWMLMPKQSVGYGRGALYVGGGRCASCHAQQYVAWQGSHHDLAMQRPEAASVLGDFEDATFTHRGVTSRFYTQDQKFLVETEGPDGRQRAYEVRYVFGADPLQQYLVEEEGGRLQALTVAWDSRPAVEGGQRWFHLQEGDPHRVTHEDPLHWTRKAFNWNTMCADCHSTALRKKYHPIRDIFATTFAELNVSCEACHGPGSGHVAWASASSLGRWWRGDGHDAHKGLVALQGPDPAGLQVESCARCHSRRMPISAADEPGEPFLDHFIPELLREGLYHPDGQILDGEEVYVYGSFLQSRMHAKQVRCTDCHDAHTARLVFEGNTLCVRCHNLSPPPAYSTIRPANYDGPEHHHHPPGTAGTSCVECHMPARTYMQIDPRHDHSFRVPRPDLARRLGVPDACTSCHTDRPVEWAVDAVEAWYGPDRRSEPHFGEVLAAGRAGRSEAVLPLAALAADLEQPAIARATALYELRRQSDPRALAAMILALEDGDALVRWAAVGGLGRLAPKQLGERLSPLLLDPIRAVRMEAARVLADPPTVSTLDTAAAAAWHRAIGEYRQAQLASAERPETHLNLGGLHARLGQYDLAEAEYRKAIRLDDTYVRAAEARLAMAALQARTGRMEEAEEGLRGMVAAPQPVGIPEGTWARLQGEAAYSLGLLAGEQTDRLKEAVALLRQAAGLLPDRPRVHYNLGLALSQAGRQDEAVASLSRALALVPDDFDILFALATTSRDAGRLSDALRYAEQLAAAHPQRAEPRALAADIALRMREERKPE